MRTALVLLFLFFALDSFAKFLPGSFEANFTEQHKSSITGKTKSSNGILKYKFPSKFRLEVLKPSELTMVSNGKTLWRYNPPAFDGENGNLSISSVGEKSFMRFFDLLKSGLVSNKNYKVKKNDQRYELSFTKNAVAEFGVEKIELSFQKSSNFKNLKSMKIFEVDSKPRQFFFKNIKITKSLKDSIFVFKEPANTRVQYNN